MYKPGLNKKFTKCNGGPYRVIKKSGNDNYVIQNVKDSSKVRHVLVEKINKIFEKPIFPAWPDENNSNCLSEESVSPINYSAEQRLLSRSNVILPSTRREVKIELLINDITTRLCVIVIP